MIRRESSFTGKTDQNGNPSSTPATASPVTVLRPVTVLPAGSGLPSASSANGSPVVFLLTSPNNIQRFGTPQQHNGIGGTPQSGPRVLLLQIPSKTVQPGIVASSSTPQPQKIVAISTTGNNSVPTKRPMLVQQSPTPNAVPQFYLTRPDDPAGSPPVKRLTLNSPLGSLARPLNVQPVSYSSALSQQASGSAATPPIKLVATPVSTMASKKGANLVQLEQARSAVRACAVESHSTPAALHQAQLTSPVQMSSHPVQQQMPQHVQHHPSQQQISQQPRIQAQTTQPQQYRQQATPQQQPQQVSHAYQSPASATPYLSGSRKAPEVKTPSIIDQGIARCITHDRKVVTSQLVPGVRLMPWSRMSEAVLALIPYHIYDTAEPPLADVLEHNLSFAARCRRLLDRKARLQKRISKVLFNQPSSRDKLESILTDQLLIQSLNEPEEEEELKEEEVSAEEDDVNESAQPFDKMLQPGPQATNDAPKLVIKFGGESGCSIASSIIDQPTRHISNQFDYDDDFMLPIPETSKTLPATDYPSYWNGSSNNSATSPSMFLANREGAEESGIGGGLSEADLAVQSIL